MKQKVFKLKVPVSGTNELQKSNSLIVWLNYIGSEDEFDPEQIL